MTVPPGRPSPYWGPPASFAPPPVARPGAAIAAAVLVFLLAGLVVAGAVWTWFLGGLDSAFRGGEVSREANVVALLSLLCFFPLVAGGVLVLLRIDRWVLVGGAAAVAVLASYWLTRGAVVLDTGDADQRMLTALVYGGLAVAAAGLALLPPVGRALAAHRAARRAERRAAPRG